MRYLYVLLLISGCASSPDVPIEQRYANAGWARGSVRQAEAECYNDLNTLRAASMRLCMRAKGWEERR